MNKKLNLKALKINSFVTSLQADFQKTIVGGGAASTLTDPIDTATATTTDK